MRAVVKEAPGAANVALREKPEPSPGPGQVKVAVTLAGICGSDLHIVHDRIALNLRLPVTLGHEFVGRIAELGEGVAGWTVGERVVSETAFRVCGRCRMCKSGHDNVCAEKELIGYVHDGAFADFVVVPAERLHRTPAGVEDAALVMAEPLAGCTHAMLEQCEIAPGDVVLITGPGTIGLISAQLAIAAGAQVILAGRSPHRLALGARLGVMATVDAGDARRAAQEIDRLTAGQGCDVFVECAGSERALALGLAAVRRRGQVLAQGLLSAPVRVDWDLIAYKELHVRGAMGQKWTAWETAMRLLASGKVDLAPLVSHTLPLEQWAKAFDLAEARSAHKIVLSMGGAESEPSEKG